MATGIQLNFLSSQPLQPGLYFDIDARIVPPGFYSSIRDAEGNALTNGRITVIAGRGPFVRLSDNSLLACPDNTIRVEPEGILVEPAANSNFWYDCLNLNNFFALTNLTSATNAIQSPVNGVDITGSLVTLTSASGPHYFNFNFTQANSYKSAWISTYLQFIAGGPTWVTIADSTAFGKWVTFDIRNGVPGKASGDLDGAFGYVSPAANGYIRINAHIPGTISNIPDVKGVIAFSNSQLQAIPVGGVMPSFVGSGQVGVWGTCGNYDPIGGQISGLANMSPMLTVGFSPAQVSGDFPSVPIPATWLSDFVSGAAYSWQKTFRYKDDAATDVAVTPIIVGTANSGDSILARCSPGTGSIAPFHLGSGSQVTAGGLGQNSAGPVAPGYHAYGGARLSNGAFSIYVDGSAPVGQQTAVMPQPTSGFSPSTINSSAEMGWIRRWNAGKGQNAILNESGFGTQPRLVVCGDNNSSTSASPQWPALLQARLTPTASKLSYNFAHEAGISDDLASVFSTWISGRDYTHVISETGMVNVLFSDGGFPITLANTATTIFAQIQTFYLACMAQGLVVYPATLFGAGNFPSWTGAKTTMLNTINASITAFASANNLILLDFYTLIGDPVNQPNINPIYLIPPSTNDNINALGHETIANYIKNTLGW